MKAGHLKGALLEYIVRNLLKNCGFTNVRADNLFTFENNGLFFINGKGAAHDADVLMNPPIQMPFSYPTQLLFECKSYKNKVGLTTVRNALGLRNDLNDFEIVTKKTIKERQKNKRANYSIDNRKRFHIQVGVASLKGFSKPAVEFATNNKIPLLSLDWFLGFRILRDFNNIDDTFVNQFDQNLINDFYKYLKDREGDLNDSKYNRVRNFLNENLIGNITSASNFVINYFHTGLLETGDMVFLYAKNPENEDILNKQTQFGVYKAKIEWSKTKLNLWKLTVSDRNDESLKTEYDFFLPNRIFNHWKTFNYDRNAAVNIKEDFLSKIFVFNSKNNPEAPFSIINIDKEWFERAKQKMAEDE